MLYQASFVMNIFEGGPLEQKIMQKVGCLDYSATQWQPVKLDVWQRRIGYKFDGNLSRFEGEVTSTQQKYPLPNRNGWIVEEVVSLQDLLLGDCFCVCASAILSFSSLAFLKFSG